MKAKAVLLSVLVAMLIMVVLSRRGGLFGRPKQNVRSAAFLSTIAAQLNKTLPRPIDSETEMTSVAGLDAVFIYNYRLLTLAAAEVDANRLVATLKPQVMQEACTTPQTRKTFIEEGIALRYSYFDKTGQHVATFEVSPSDCP